MSLVRTPDDSHDIFQLAQSRQSAEALAERARHLPHEWVVERIAVYVDDSSLGVAVQRGERGRSVRVDGGETGLASRGVAAVPLQLRVWERVAHLDDGLATVRRGQHEGRVILDRPAVQAGRQPPVALSGGVAAALQKQIGEVRTQVGQAAPTGALQVEHPPVAVAVVALW